MIILIFCSLLVIDVISPNEGVTGRQECSVCGMWIDQYEHTRHLAITKDGKTIHFCNFACAAKGMGLHKDEIKTIKVADFITKSMTDANKAYYLEGSDIPGLTGYISRIAFASQTDAIGFQKRYGGRIVTLREALRES